MEVGEIRAERVTASYDARPRPTVSGRIVLRDFFPASYLQESQGLRSLWGLGKRNG